MKAKLVILLAIGVFVSFPLFAHHGAASFETGKTAVLKGTVTKWIYANPHLLLMLDVTGDDGKVVHWVLESNLQRSCIPAVTARTLSSPGIKSLSPPAWRKMASRSDVLSRRCSPTGQS